ncbi:transposase [Microbulbifer sp. 2304DJ12-6]|uniref:transposase n=1 Tax=Microbulbifer sp. 2304DJ12-6 TaxID=3233340 RepID=UPI0039B07A06
MQPSFLDLEDRIIRDYEITSAEVRDSQVLHELLSDNTSKDVWADSAYYSEESGITLDAMGCRSHEHKKGNWGKALSKRDTEENRRKSRVRVRVRVEHVFGSMENEQGGMLVRTIGILRAAIKVGMKNLVYNMRRFVSFQSRRAPAV